MCDFGRILDNQVWPGSRRCYFAILWVHPDGFKPEEFGKCWDSLLRTALEQLWQEKNSPGVLFHLRHNSQRFLALEGRVPKLINFRTIQLKSINSGKIVQLDNTGTMQSHSFSYGRNIVSSCVFIISSSLVSCPPIEI